MISYNNASRIIRNENSDSISRNYEILFLKSVFYGISRIEELQKMIDENKKGLDAK